MALKPITVNTPAAEPAHILAEDDAAIYAALIGDDRVLDIGGKLAATVISNNKVRITDGVVVVGGHAAIIFNGNISASRTTNIRSSPSTASDTVFIVTFPASSVIRSMTG